MTDIFVSYAHEDRPTVRELVGLMERAGFDVWWDRQISVGRDLNTVIDAKLAESRVVVVVWSRSSIRSMWVRGEAADALEAGKLVPVALEPVRYPIPFSLCETVDLCGWPEQACSDGIARFLQALNSATERKAASPARPVVPTGDAPTFSVRVARRVQELIDPGRERIRGDPALRSELDKTLAEAALLLLEGSAWKTLPDGLLMSLLACLSGGRLSAWQRGVFLWGDPDLKPGLDDAPETSPTLKTSGARWLFTASDEKVVLLAEGSDTTRPPAWLVERLFTCHRILVHWRRDRSPGES